MPIKVLHLRFKGANRKFSIAVDADYIPVIYLDLVAHSRKLYSLHSGIENVKLPNGFYISTPVGKYNPDWAIAFYEGEVKHIYFIAETKGSMSSMQLRDIEKGKIHCAREHFKAISKDDVIYDVIDSYQSLLNIVMK